MKTKRSLILLFAFSLLSLSAFKGKKSNALVLNANHSWKTEVSYDKAANIAGYILHNDKLTEIVIINMDDLGFYTDNIEGMTFGPVLPNGHKTLIFIADNNFDIIQKAQLLLFEVIE